ncbi:MAG: PEP-CTERM/exosortase system-associated acyltransferase [Desulfobacterales bacterium]|nr:PEP-CTERM/exosortase system-associated acyltransferase [Desulfobacterales bacterium]
MLKNEIAYGQFRFGLIDDEKIKKDTFRMRYEVYVDEFGFENKEDHPSGLETDDFENDSLHFACLNESNSVVGTLRLVKNSDQGFPIEHATHIDFPGTMPDRDQIGEISRLTVAKDLRRRKEDGIHGVESYLTKREGGILPDDGTIPQEMQGRKNPIIVLGLYQVMYQESKRQDITHWYMITEDKVFHALKKYDFLFNKIGEPVFYHGWRTPYLGVVEEIEKNVFQRNPGMFKAMLSSLEPEYCPKLT